MLLGVDVGGTFTDAVLLDGGDVHTAKVPTTPGEESAGVIGAVEEVLAAAGAKADEVESFAHGMTVGTNALLEERGARTALIATRGFADLLEIARQDRPDLYRLCAPKPTAAGRAGAALRGRRSGSARRASIEPLADERAAAPGRAAARERRRVGRDLPALLLPRPRPRAAPRRAPARAPARPPRLRLARGAAPLPRVRALLDDRDRRLPLPPARPLPGPARRGGARRPACPSRW